ncbi:DUF5316 family protein [Paenibacillus sp. KN14-4R]|uniref:DUF5316 family protein n=1 Tax=Paenibacillus sp. KN14-4R TaxID=3445773 RepID=UPI003F9F92AE
MKNLYSLLIGIGILLVISLVAYLTGEVKIIVNYAGILGLLSIGISAVLTGGFADSGTLRTGYRDEQGREDRENRMKWATYFLLIGLPNLAVAVVLYFQH